MAMKKDIKGYEGFYQIDELGNIYSVERVVEVLMPYGIKLQKVPAAIRKCSDHGTGYKTIRLAKNGQVKTYRVHRLVAQAFIPNPYDKPFVNHVDGNKKNNKMTNLEWVTEKENTAHAIATGLKPENIRCHITGQYLITRKIDE
tara:strand:- start:52054 stop:52485 length:432 start_codon:yes stop_codon:yes gene_type:complete